MHTGWALLDTDGTVRCVSFTHDPAEESDGRTWRPVDAATVAMILDGTIPLSAALLPDPLSPVTDHGSRRSVGDNIHVRSRDINGVRCTFLGRYADDSLWSMILGYADLARLRGMHMVIWDWRHHEAQLIHHLFPWAAWDELVSMHGINSIMLIIDSHWEAPNTLLHLEPLAKRLCQQGMSRARLIDWNNIRCDSDYLTTIDCGYGPIIGYNTQHVPAPTSPNPSHHFIMLARQPRPLRVMAAVQILRRDMLRFGHMSCGVNGQAHRDWINRWVPADLQDRFPMIMDAQIGQTDILQYAIDDPRIKDAAINVICETSCDPDLWPERIEWFDPFITEKSTKAIRLHQLPLWVGVVGQVQKMRELGIDVYDDVIDHSYDLIIDPHERIDRVFAELQRWCDKPLSEISDIMQDLWPRMSANRIIIECKMKSIIQDMGNLLQQHIDKTRVEIQE